MSAGSAVRVSGVRIMLGGIAARPMAGILAILFSLINGASMVAGAWAIGWATEHFVLASFQEGRPLIGAAWFVVLAILGVSLFRMSTILLRGLLTGRVQFGGQADSRRALTRRLLDLDPSWHRRNRPGALMSTMVSDVDYTWQAMNLFPFAIGMAFMLVIAAIRIVLVDPALAVIALVLVPLVFGANLLYQRALGPRARAAQEERARLTEFVHEAVAGRPVIRTAGLDAAFERDFADRAARLRDAHTRVGAVSASFEPIIELLPSAAMLALLAVGAGRLSSGAIDVAHLVEFVYLLQTMTIPLNIISRFLSQLPLARAGAARVRAVLDAPERTEFGGRELPAGPHAVRLEGVVVRYGERSVLDVPGMDIDRGAWIAVAGDIGAGKTTLARLLVRAQDADEGTVAVAGVDVRDYAETQLGGSIAFVAQEPVILRDSVRGVVALDRRLSDDEIHAALRTAAAETFVVETGGLDREVAQETLSGGQRQRLAIARAVAREPGVLVLDDPTAALDATTEHELVVRLREYRRRTGATLITATNHVRLLREADRVVLLDDGRIVADAPHDVLVATHPQYRALLASGGSAS